MQEEIKNINIKLIENEKKRKALLNERISIDSKIRNCENLIDKLEREKKFKLMLEERYIIPATKRNDILNKRIPDNSKIDVYNNCILKATNIKISNGIVSLIFNIKDGYYIIIIDEENDVSITNNSIAPIMFYIFKEIIEHNIRDFGMCFFIMEFGISKRLFVNKLYLDFIHHLNEKPNAKNILLFNNRNYPESNSQH
jgi:hypothetical protein